MTTNNTIEEYHGRNTVQGTNARPVRAFARCKTVGCVRDLCLIRKRGVHIAGAVIKAA